MQWPLPFRPFCPFDTPGIFLPRLSLAVLATFPVLATGPATAETAMITAGVEDIVVKGQGIARRERAFSATVLETAEIRRHAVGDFDELFRHVPGMAVRDLGLGGVANNIVIRGFGGGGHGGDLGAVIDGIPLNEAMSHADGYVDFNLIVPLEVGALTVYHGPVSALYGNYNRGGLVNIETRKSGDYLQVDASGGAFATGGLQFALGKPLGDTQQINAAGQYQLTDGFRPRSDAERQTLSARWAIDLAPGFQMALSGRFHHADAASASYLTAAQFDDDPRGIDPRVENDGAKKNFASVRADMNVLLAEQMKLLSFAYVTRQDFTRWFTRPVAGGAWRQREESYDRQVFGAGVSLNGEIAHGIGAGPWSYAAGVETFREQTDFTFHDGLVGRRRTAAALNDRETRLHSISAFAEMNAPLHPLLELSLGLRDDRFSGGCTPQGPESGNDPCGELTPIKRLSPKIGFTSGIAPGLELRGSWAEGFALPNNFVKYAIGGQDLDANIFRQTEIGVKLTGLPALTLDVAAFRLTSSDEVRTVAPGIFENFGRTRRQGIEVRGEWRPESEFWVKAVYSRTKTRVVENADARLIDLEIAGVPKYLANVNAGWSPVMNWSVEANWRLVDGYAVDALNTIRADSYKMLDLTIAHSGSTPFEYRASVRVENVTNRRHATSMSQIGGETLLAPGAPRGLFVGFQADF